MDIAEEFINYMAENLKHTDLIEILAAYPKTPINILISQAVQNSDPESLCYKYDKKGNPAVLGGITPIEQSTLFNNIYSSAGSPWFITTPDWKKDLSLMKHMLRKAPLWLGDAKTKYDILYNYVWEKNQQSLNLLKHLGFTVNYTIHNINNTGLNFIIFFMENNSYVPSPSNTGRSRSGSADIIPGRTISDGPS